MCVGADDITKTPVRDNTIAIGFSNNNFGPAESQLCKYEYVETKTKSCRPWSLNGKPNPPITTCSETIPMLGTQTSDKLEDGATDFACFFGDQYPPPKQVGCNQDLKGHCISAPAFGTYIECAKISQNADPDCTPNANPDNPHCDYLCNPLDRSGCTYNQCLFRRSSWTTYTGETPGTVQPANTSDPTLAHHRHTDDLMLEPDPDFEAHPWTRLSVGPDANNRFWVQTTQPRMGLPVPKPCRVPVDYFYGNVPSSWGWDDIANDPALTTDWFDAVGRCGSGDVFNFDPAHPNVSGPRYPFSDTPLPMPELPAKCYSGQMGISEFNVQASQLKLKQVKEEIEAKSGDLQDQFETCSKLSRATPPPLRLRAISQPIQVGPHMGRRRGGSGGDVLLGGYGGASCWRPPRGAPHY